jgi:hypothetical protein
MAKLHQIIVYLDEDLAGSVRAAARQRRTSASAYAKTILQRELTAERPSAPDSESLLAAILIGVDALVKHHPNTKLFGVVKATRSAKLGASSDEA